MTSFFADSITFEQTAKMSVTFVIIVPSPLSKAGINKFIKLCDNKFLQQCFSFGFVTLRESEEMKLLFRQFNA